MSIPHTGELHAVVRGIQCQFDGDKWITPNEEISKILNEATHSSPKTHADIKELAEHVLHKTGLFDSSKILSYKCDVWTDAIPPDAED